MYYTCTSTETFNVIQSQVRTMNMRKASERKRKIHAFLMSMTMIKMKFNRKCSSHTITIFHHINILSVINANEFQAPHLL